MPAGKLLIVEVQPLDVAVDGVTGEVTYTPQEDVEGDPVFVEITGMNAFDLGLDEDADEEYVFNETYPRRYENDPVEEYSIGGFSDMDDPGQNETRKAARDRQPRLFRIRPNGVDGYTQRCRVGSRSYSIGAGDKTQGISFDFYGVEAPVGIPGNEWLP